MNQIFGYQIFPEDNEMGRIAFGNSQPVSIGSTFNGQYGQLKLFTYPNTHLKTWTSQEKGVCSYVWGIPAHPDITAANIPKWCAKIVGEKQYTRFRELIGPFVVIIDEPRNHRITVITDILGVRPIFFSMPKGRLVLGSKVWPIQKAGLSNGAIDYDAVASWIAYGYNCTGGSLFSDLRRLPPGVAVVFQDKQFSEIPYVEFEPKSQSHSEAQAAEKLHQIVSSSIKTLLAEQPRISIALSGGYDSRYLLMLCRSLKNVSISCAAVDTTQAEGDIACRVTNAVKIPLKRFHVDNSEWDLYDSVYHVMADGFPISKFVTYPIAQHYPQIPMVNGYLGDGLMRGSKDKFLGKYETEWKGDLVDVLQRKHLFNTFKIFRKHIANRILLRSRPPMEEAVKKAAKSGKAFNIADFYYRQRHYIANNFLQHIQISEAVLPFYSWPLLRYKMNHDNRVFDKHIYHRIFRNHFPEVADIPNVVDYPSVKIQRFCARCTKRRARQLLRILSNKKWLTLLRKERAIPLSVFAA